MKKGSFRLLSLFISIMMITMLLPGQTAKAATTPDGMFNYTVSEGNATITGLANEAYTGPLTLPSTISDGSNTYNVTAIGERAFGGEGNLIGLLTIPSSVTSIGYNAFIYCSGLTDINVSSENPTYSSRNGILYDKVQRELIRCPGGKVGQITIPDSVTTIGDYAFVSCSGLTGPLTIPDSVTTIGDYAFSGCSGLTDLLTIPDSVTSIGMNAFHNCSGLTGPLTIQGSVANIRSGAFSGCSGITDINVSSENPSYSSIDGILYDKVQGKLIQCPAGKVGQVTIPDSVTSIGGFAFVSCSGLTGPLTIPDSVTRIGDWAFEGCSGLTGLTIGSSVTTIGSEAFRSCNAIKTIIAKPVNAPKYVGIQGVADSIGLPYSAVLYTPNTPPDNTSYNVGFWSLFVRGILQPTAEVVSGVNRFDTAALISKRLNASANTVILTTGRNFPDALSAGPLAVQKNAPILLAEVNKIPIETLNEINRLGASKVIILGGLGAMDSSVEATLKNLGLSVERISGATRFLTAIETAKQVRASSGQLDRAILANGYGFADALSIGSYAAKEGIPILLTAANSLSPETKTAMIEFGIKKIDIIGGELAVSKAVESQLQAMGITVSRISGASRFATSAAIAGTYFAASENAIVSNGQGFVDALAAVPLAVKQNAPILLVEKDSLPVVMSNYLGSSSIKNITITGGELAVSSTVKNQILNILNSGGL